MKYYQFSLALTLFIASTCFGQQQRTALFIGNSYTYSNNLPSLIQQVASSKGNSFTYTTQTPGGYSFNAHVGNSTSIARIQQESYDVLILQGQSAELAGTLQGEGKHTSPNFYEAEYLHQLSQSADTCHQTLLFMTWGYFASLQDYITMQDNVSANYEELAHTIDVGVSPVGEAWREVLLNYPNITLHSADLSHPTLAGSYLAACVFYAAIFQQDPIGAWSPAGLSTQEVQVLQQVASSTVLSELSRWNIAPPAPGCITGAPITNEALWDELPFPSDQEIAGLQFTSSSTGYAQCSFPYSLYVTHNQGNNWDSIAIPAADFRFNTHFVSDSIGFFATSNYAVDSTTLDTNTNNPWGIPRVTTDHVIYPVVYKTSDAGANWTKLPLDSSALGIHFNARLNGYFLYDIGLHFDNEQRGTLVFSHGIIKPDTVYALQTTDGGNQWQQYENELIDMHDRVFFQSADTIYISSYKDNSQQIALWQSVDGGEQWQLADSVALGCCQALITYQHVNAVHFTSNGPMIANNLFTPLLTQLDATNLSWTAPIQTPFVGELLDIEQGSSDQELFGLFENNLSHRIGFSSDGGQTWQVDSYHDNELSILERSDTHLYAAGREGTILRRAIDVASGIPALEEQQASLLLFPNPAEDELNIQLPEDVTDFPVVLTIYDLAGRPQQEVMLNTVQTSLQINDLASGIYFCKTNTTPVRTGKFIIR